MLEQGCCDLGFTPWSGGGVGGGVGRGVRGPHRGVLGGGRRVGGVLRVRRTVGGPPRCRVLRVVREGRRGGG